ncbi:olfactory receptor 10G4-like [Erpetoichthys calabaricus]|uniref:olfactory receptor 10G4-like n=1 Tax=Erpetoichthys calabaricus TaxID=27687 RepID=UPI002233ED19|nr:olfactory receptor 10G4-like [Erpetoichthys calabaricus]
MNHNTSQVEEFIIVGFPGLQDQESRAVFSGIFLVAYLLILLGNLLIILIFAMDESLHTPMYMLICSLAFLDVILSSVVIPKMLVVFMFDSKAITFVACFIQLLFYHGMITAESFLLGLMAYDRYMAILIPIVLALRLPFCGPNKVLHCFCDHVSVVRLTCADITINSYVALTISLSTLFIPLTYILFSYIRIIRSVFKIASSEGRLKAFSTCGTHLLVISVFFLIAAGVYISYRVPGTSADMRIMAAVLQNVIPPLMNPIIYCLRTKEIRDSFVKRIQRTQILPK